MRRARIAQQGLWQPQRFGIELPLLLKGVRANSLVVSVAESLLAEVASEGTDERAVQDVLLVQDVSSVFSPAGKTAAKWWQI